MRGASRCRALRLCVARQRGVPLSEGGTRAIVGAWLAIYPLPGFFILILATALWGRPNFCMPAFMSNTCSLAQLSVRSFRRAMPPGLTRFGPGIISRRPLRSIRSMGAACRACRWTERSLLASFARLPFPRASLSLPGRPWGLRYSPGGHDLASDYFGALEVAATGCRAIAAPVRSYASGGATRGCIKEFSSGAARRLIRFISSLNVVELEGSRSLYGLTLTVRDTPSLQEWRCATQAFYRHLRYHGILYVSVLELQRRGAPHLHLLLAVPKAVASSVPSRLGAKWCKLVGHGALPRAQWLTTIFDVDGWNKYLAKHSLRAPTHRQKGAVPSWETMPRTWSASKGWPRWSEAFVTTARAASDVRRALARVAMRSAGRKIGRISSFHGARYRTIAERLAPSVVPQSLVGEYALLVRRALPPVEARRVARDALLRMPEVSAPLDVWLARLRDGFVLRSVLPAFLDELGEMAQEGDRAAAAAVEILWASIDCRTRLRDSVRPADSPLQAPPVATLRPLAASQGHWGASWLIPAVAP